jgi:hypothetical protein
MSLEKKGQLIDDYILYKKIRENEINFKKSSIEFENFSNSSLYSNKYDTSSKIIEKIEELFRSIQFKNFKTANH